MREGGGSNLGAWRSQEGLARGGEASHLGLGWRGWPLSMETVFGSPIGITPRGARVHTCVCTKGHVHTRTSGALRNPSSSQKPLND